MEVLGPETVKALKNRKNKGTFHWLMTLGLGKYRDENVLLVINDEEANLIVTFPDNPQLNDIVGKEIAEINKRLNKI